MNIVCANPLKQFHRYQDEIETAVIKVLRSKCYILGTEVRSFENEFANYVDCRYGIGVANGTDAIEIALRSLNIGKGDEVITVSHTAVATIAAIEATGATPVLVDIEEDTFTLNPTQIEYVISEKTKAVVAVHLYGQAANITTIKEICDKRNIQLIEDCAQAHGGLFNGKKLGSFGKLGCFSCYPTKNLSAIGDGGIITTNDSELASRCKEIREYGWRKKFISEVKGKNSRLDEIQAAILRVKLKYLDEDNSERQKIALIYDNLLKETSLRLPFTQKGNVHVYHQYVIRTNAQKDLLDFLRENSVFAGIHYPMPIHLQPAYKNKVKIAKDLSVTEQVAKQIISLPIYPGLTIEEIELVSQLIKQFHIS